MGEKQSSNVKCPLGQGGGRGGGRRKKEEEEDEEGGTGRENKRKHKWPGLHAEQQEECGLMEAKT